VSYGAGVRWPGGLVVVGGSDAGIMAALWAREFAPELPITVVLKDAYPNFSICGIPFLVSGETPEWPMLAHRTGDELAQLGLDLLTNCDVQAINPTAQVVHAVGARARR
jgi:NADPH-dependent 2,4-dienoyl-CoA reductase/sulfur reductase-like enzyme